MGEARSRFVGEPAEHHVCHAVDLFVCGADKAWVSVSVGCGPPGRHGVDKRAPVGELEGDAVGPDDGEVAGAGRGVGVPDVRGVDRGDLVRRHGGLSLLQLVAILNTVQGGV